MIGHENVVQPVLPVAFPAMVMLLAAPLYVPEIAPVEDTDNPGTATMEKVQPTHVLTSWALNGAPRTTRVLAGGHVTVGPVKATVQVRSSKLLPPRESVTLILYTPLVGVSTRPFLRLKKPLAFRFSVKGDGNGVLIVHVYEGTPPVATI